MKKYRTELLIIYFVYVLLFIAVSMYDYPIIDEGGRIMYFYTLYQTNLYIPFLANTIFLLYIVIKSTWSHWQ